jgi:hypothetical protein
MKAKEKIEKFLMSDHSIFPSFRLLYAGGAVG